MKKRHIVLFIDTSSHERISVAVEEDGKKFESTSSSKTANAQNVLPLIEKLLKARGLKLSDITEIRVNCGPGSFTGARVGVAVANMIGSLLSVPINGKKVGETVLPVYTPSKLDSDQ
ncbi:tRNA (adenosine(37)-N6)-threonylcarbamoyltransferase complex dimerization subunit type 1 TsaB [Candidatus Gottesmanbacteria bacterium]|nr:tRNA (adenosine(37)-N6)-threonylcarbamoyltransferase complex dimerization subunit type 1 TsaB [Candidatus Gottesmanbacteria bacterium]